MNNVWVFGYNAQPAWERAPQNGRTHVKYVHIEMAHYAKHILVPWNGELKAPAHRVTAEPWDGFTRDPVISEAMCGECGCPWPHKWTPYVWEEKEQQPPVLLGDDADANARSREVPAAAAAAAATAAATTAAAAERGVYFIREWEWSDFNVPFAHSRILRQVEKRKQKAERYELLNTTGLCSTELPHSHTELVLSNQRSSTIEDCGKVCSKYTTCVAFSTGLRTPKRKKRQKQTRWNQCQLLHVDFVASAPHRPFGRHVEMPRESLATTKQPWIGWEEQRCYVRVHMRREEIRARCPKPELLKKKNF